MMNNDDDERIIDSTAMMINGSKQQIQLQIHIPEIVIPKTSWSGTQNTPLLNILQMYNIQTVLLCGLLTSVCVQQTAFGIFEAGYETLLVEDACGDRGIARHNAALLLYANYMYKTITSTQLQNHIISLQQQQQQQQEEEQLKQSQQQQQQNENNNKENNDILQVTVNYPDENNNGGGTVKPPLPPWGVTPTSHVGVGGGGHPFPQNRRRRSMISPIPHSSTSSSRERVL